MAYELIDQSDYLNAGRLKLNHAFSAQTNVWSSSTGSNSIISNNSTGNLASGSFAIAFGHSGLASGNLSTIGGGKSNTSSGLYSSIFGGSGNTASGISTSIIGGQNIIGTLNNTVYMPNTFVVGSISATTIFSGSTNLQNTFNEKQDKLIAANRQTDSYTLVLADANKLVEMNKGTVNDLTVPPNSAVTFSTGTQILLSQYGAGKTTVVAGAGVTIRSTGGKLSLTAQYSVATLLKIGTNEWYLFGDISV